MLTCGLYESSQSTVVFPPIHFLLFIQFRVAFELEPIPGAHLNFTRYLDGWIICTDTHVHFHELDIIFFSKVFELVML